MSKKITIYLIINRVLILAAAYFMSNIKPLGLFLLTFGKRWDGNSYTFIATHWYVTAGDEKNFIVFPPLYPLFIKFVSFLKINPVVSGIIISNVFFILAMLLLYKLVSKYWNQRIAKIVVLLISIFPTTYYFSVAYPESLFIFLLIACFYLAGEKRYLFSAILGGLAAITRPFGIIIFPSIFLFAIKDKKIDWKKILLATIIFSAPILYYLWLNYSIYGNTFAFTHFLRNNWYKSFGFPWSGIIESWKRGIFTTNSFEYKYIVGYSEAIASTIAWILTFISFKKWKDKLPYLSYVLLGTILFTSTSFILSAPRYLLSIPFFFILISEIFSKKKLFLYIWIPVSSLLLIYLMKLFAAGHWVF